ncbi:MAG: hypothetical protein LBR53_03080 [Deltaproteobacteria bacterium]|jgi:hypothetical protein|nr:hypothetical protein [Deltaproteobacteria bacterium]
MTPEGNGAGDDASKFTAWADAALKDGLPPETVALCFNLYEEADSDDFSVQLILSDRYDPDCDDWATEEIFTTGENLYYIPRNNDEVDWDEALELAIRLAESYLEKSSLSFQLNKLRAVAVGFVDGVLEKVYENDAN